MILQHTNLRRLLSSLFLISFLSISFALFAEDGKEDVTSYNIYVAGYAVTSQNADTIKGPGIEGRVYYDAKTNTLTLDNATLTGHDSIGTMIISKTNDLKIQLIGKNKITDKGNISSAFHSEKAITIVGDTLEIEMDNDKSFAFYVSQLSIENAFIIENIFGKSQAICFQTEKTSTHKANIAMYLYSEKTNIGFNCSILKIDESSISIQTDSTSTTSYAIQADSTSITNSTIEGEIYNKDTSTEYIRNIFFNSGKLSAENSTINIFSKGNICYGISGDKIKLDKTRMTINCQASYGATGIYAPEISVLNSSEINNIINAKDIYAIRSNNLICKNSTLSSKLIGTSCTNLKSLNILADFSTIQSEINSNKISYGLDANKIQLHNDTINEQITNRIQESSIIDVIGIRCDSLESINNQIILSLNGFKGCGIYGNDAIFQKGSLEINGEFGNDMYGLNTTTNTFDNVEFHTNINAKGTVIINSAKKISSSKNIYNFDKITGTTGLGFYTESLNMSHDSISSSFSDIINATGIQAAVAEISNTSINQTINANTLSMGIRSDSTLKIDSCKIQFLTAGGAQAFGIYAKDINLLGSSYNETGDQVQKDYGIWTTTANLIKSNININVTGESAAALIAETSLDINNCEVELSASTVAISNTEPKLSYTNPYILVNTKNESEGAIAWDKVNSIASYKYVKISTLNPADIFDVTSEPSYYIVDKTIYSTSGNIQVYSVTGQLMDEGETITVPTSGLYVIKAKQTIGKVIIK